MDYFWFLRCMWIWWTTYCARKSTLWTARSLPKNRYIYKSHWIYAIWFCCKRKWMGMHNRSSNKKERVCIYSFRSFSFTDTSKVCKIFTTIRWSSFLHWRPAASGKKSSLSSRFGSSNANHRYIRDKIISCLSSTQGGFEVAPYLLYMALLLELIELTFFCAMGSLIELHVREVFLSLSPSQKKYK